MKGCGNMDRVDKLIKKDSDTIKIAVVFLVILVCAIAWIYKVKDVKPVHLLEVDKESVGAYININAEPYGFASKVGDDSWLAIAMDENNYMYIVRTRKINSEISKLALDAYNGIVSEEKQLKESEFEDYFGDMYLEMGITADISIQVVLATVSSILFISLIIVGLISKKRTKKVMESEEYQKAIIEADMPELDSKTTILTKNYIIYYNAGLHIASYNDLAWIYRHTVTYNGVPNHSFAYYIKGNKKVNFIGFGFDKKKVEELIAFIYQKNPNVLVGFTSENKKIFKEMQ